MIGVGTSPIFLVIIKGMEASLEMYNNGPQRTKVLFLLWMNKPKKVLMWSLEAFDPCLSWRRFPKNKI